MHMYHLKVESLSRVQAARCKRLLEGSLIACAHADQRARTALWHRLSYHSVSGGDPDCVKPKDCWHTRTFEEQNNQANQVC